jgi:hypothetical protein
VVAYGQASVNPPVSGRITSLAVSSGGTRIYAASSNGGVWYSDNSGATWEPVEDYFMSGAVPAGIEADSLSVGAVAVNFGMTRADDSIYVGTGEANQNQDAYFGVGVRRFGPPAGGGTAAWTLEATNLAGKGIARLIIDVDNPERVYAATTVGLFVRPVGGGAAWTALAPPIPPPPFATDVVAASTAVERRYYVGYLGGIVWAFNPNTNIWTQLTGITAGLGERIGLAAVRVPGAAADQHVIYVLTQGGLLYRLRPGPANTTFVQVGGVPPVFAFGQGWYDLAVEIEPGTANTVWLAGDITWSGTNWDLSLWRGTISVAGTLNFGFTNMAAPNADATYMGRNIHGDGHAIAFPSAGAASSVWVGCDGGVFRSTTPTVAGSFQPVNVGLAITQMTYLAQRSDTDAVLFSGCQDNGNLRFRGEAAWFESPQGDGGGVTIDPNNQYRVMRQYIRAGLWLPSGTFQAGLSVAMDGGVGPFSWSDLRFPPVGVAPTAAQKAASNVEDSRTAFYAPIDSVVSGGTTIAAFGTNRLWLTTDWGTTWTTLPTYTNPYASGGTNLTQDVLDDPDPTTQWQSPYNTPLPSPITGLKFASGTRLFVATANRVWRFDRGAGGVWTRTPLPTAGLPAMPITDLYVEDATSGSIYVTVGGSTPSHLYYFPGGPASSWSDTGLGAAGMTLNSPCHAVVVDPLHPQDVYAGSDVGCWKGTKTGANAWTWTLFSQDLPEVAITDLAIHERTRLLRAATHGRGVWEIDLDTPGPASPELYMRVNTADTGRLRGPGGTRYPWVENHPDPTRSGFNVFHWMSPDIKVRRPSLAGLPALSTPPNFLDFAANMGDYIDTNNVETADLTTNQVFVQVHNRSLSSVAAADVRVLLLLTDAAIGLPSLPPNYATHLVNGDPATRTMGGWLAGTAWFPGDAAVPYRTPPAAIDARVSQVVDYTVNIGSLGLPATHYHVCAAAFVTTLSSADRLTATEPSLDALTMRDRRAVHRNLHIVAAGTRPAANGGFGAPEPQTFIIDAHNTQEREDRIEILFDKRALKGSLSLLLPFLDPRIGFEFEGGKALATRDFEGETGKHWQLWTATLEQLLDKYQLPLEWPRNAAESHKLLHTFIEKDFAADLLGWRLLKLATLDRTVAYVTGDTAFDRIQLTLPLGGLFTMALTWSPAYGGAPGEQYRLDVVQQRGKAIVGGSTYILAVIGAQ